jgi:hypothetical protein
MASPGPAAATGDLARIGHALVGIAGALAADGYTMRVAGLENRRLKIVIEANEDACAECLVQPELMASMIRTELPTEFGVSEIELVYPGDHSQK